jgi:hypothetical protein
MNRWLQWAVAVIIIALVGGLFFYLTATGTAKARDVQRLADSTVVRVALEHYYFMRNEYPVAVDPVVLGSADARALCLDVGWSSGEVACETPLLRTVAAGPQAADYGYRYISDGEAYSLHFYIEKTDTGLNPGWHVAGPAGIE